MVLLADAEWRGWGNREISRRTGVDDKTVGNIRKAGCAEIPQVRRYLRKGKVCQQKMPRRAPKQTMEAAPPAEVAKSVTEKTPAAPQLKVAESMWGTFKTIVVVPPWPLPGEDATATVEAIRPLPIGRLAAGDCVLWVWSPSHLLATTIGLAESWGFAFQTVGTWMRINHCPSGKWLGYEADHCVLSAKGEPQPGCNPGFPRLVDFHGFYELVESLCPAPRAQVYAPHQRQDWVSIPDARPERMGSGSYNPFHDP
jgi:hypothetical protein